MFSTPTKKSALSVRRNATARRDANSTPLGENPRPLFDSPGVLTHPGNRTPAPWTSRQTGLVRAPPAKRSHREIDADAAGPACIGEFPQAVRDALLMPVRNRVPSDGHTIGGMDKETSVAWIICGNSVFIWNYLSSPASRKCIVLDLPSTTLGVSDTSRSSFQNKNWLACVVNWDSSKKTSNEGFQLLSPAGFILCNKKTPNLIFWPDICNTTRISPPPYVVCTDLVTERSCPIGCLIASAIPDSTKSCVAIASSSNGFLWRFLCSPSGIQCSKIEHAIYRGYDSNAYAASKEYPRSLMWHTVRPKLDDHTRQFLLLTNQEIQCFAVELSVDINVLKLWSHKIGGTDDLSGQKRILPLALDVDIDENVISILIAVFCIDRLRNSSYTEYSLLSLQYKSGVDISKPRVENVLEEKAPIQVISRKAGEEAEDVLFSMRLKVGGHSSSSAIIIAGDGTATISHYWRNSTILYHFDLPTDAGKVLDASLLNSVADSKEVAWAILTEKDGIWAIPEREILRSGVKPPDQSFVLKRDNTRSIVEDRRDISVGNIAARGSSSEDCETSNRQMTGLAGVLGSRPEDEESESLVRQLFDDFLLHGQVDGVLNKLKSSGAFDKEGETNPFTRISKSIVDTLAKHWTTTRGPEIALSLVGAQLVEKYQKHHKFLQFLALSKCHEELCSKQRLALQLILEHGEKIGAIIQLKELQNTFSRATSFGLGSYGSDSGNSGALWDLIQLVGDRARRTTVLLIDRDNAEVFYSRVSDLQQIFFCLEKQLDYVISGTMPVPVQFRRACELANACVTLWRAASQYRSEHHIWYPPPTGLIPWYSETVVCHGMWSVASFILQLLNETNLIADSVMFDIYSNLELLSEVLLESCDISIAARVERNEEHRALLDEYWKRRDNLLHSLYQQVKFLVTAKLQDSAEENEEQSKDILMELSSNLLSIAKKHGAYQTMWSLCSDLNDSELLRSLMHESSGSKGGFSCFVFKQLYESKQFSMLMRLGEEFNDELITFLKQHPDLLWLQEVFLSQFSSASKTLHEFSLSMGDIPVSSSEATEFTSRRRILTLEKRKYFLNLAKISAIAGGDDELKVKRIEADLNILQIQEEILSLMPDDEDKEAMTQKLLPTMDLIELCLQIPERQLSLRAFDLFSWSSASFVTRNTSLLEKCWMNAANQDDWSRLNQISATSGWSDERIMEILHETVLFQASSKCYGPEAEFFDVRYDQVFPLRFSDATPSAEAVLMQHRDYPDAGKLMLTAIIQGSICGAGSSTAELDEEDPME